MLDLFSRRIVGWAMASHMRTDLVMEALTMAVGNRLPDEQLMHHSDRGSPYASFAYQQDTLAGHGISCSMSRRGECHDNAVAESFFGTLKTELIHRETWPTRASARSAIHDYIEIFYNRKRRHSTLGGRPPAEFEADYDKAADAA
ncbi:MAG: putative transposase [Pseudohongiellaceae bacterium]